MKKRKILLGLALASAMVFSLASCGEDAEIKDNTNIINENGGEPAPSENPNQNQEPSEAKKGNNSVEPEVTLTSLYQTVSFDSVPYVDGKDSKGNPKKYIDKNFNSGVVTLVANETEKMEFTSAEKEYKNFKGDKVTSTNAINTGVTTENRYIEIDLSAYTGEVTIEIYGSHTSSSGDARTAHLKADSITGDSLLDITYQAGVTPSLSKVNLKCGKKYYFTSDASVRIYAINFKEAEVVKYTVSFENANGSAPEALKEQTKIVYANLPTYNVVNKKTFDGWLLNGELVTGDVELSSNVTLVAKWTDIPADQIINVTFKDSLGNTISTAEVIKNGKITSFPTVNVDNYRFDGWYADESLTTEYNKNSTIVTETTVYAKLVEQHTVSFYDINDEVIATKTVDHDTTLDSLPAGKFVYGYSFKYWSLTKGGTEFKISEEIMDNTILYPVYEEATVDQINLVSYGADQESVYAEFMPFDGADKYAAYVIDADNKETKLDDQLIRYYKGDGYNYYRVDAIGLKAGKYSLKIVPIHEGSEIIEAQTIVSDLNAIAYDRSGFAFSANSPLKDASGAYNADGTLKAGAKVLYVTNENAKTITTTVDGNVCTGLQAIIAAKQKKNSTEILDIRIVGTIYASSMDSFGSSAEGIQIKGATARQNMKLTIEGVGNDAGIHGFGILIRSCGNVELRNFAVMNCMDDSISVDTDNCNLFIHDLDLFYGQTGGDADQAKGDGTIDLKLSQYITVAYNHYWDSGKASLCDAGVKGDNSVDYVTFHHNWFDHSDSRHPRIRNASSMHIYNNYYDGVSKYGVGAAGGGTSAFVENNYFRNTKFPMLSSKQGSDAYAGTDTLSTKNYTFSGEDGGIIKSFGNVMEGSYTYIPYGCSEYVCKGTTVSYTLTNAVSTQHFDAYEASSRDEIVPESVKSLFGGFTYSNFDTAAAMYTYEAQSAEAAKETVIQYAGRTQGGDFKWEFDNSVEDTNYSVITGLKTAVVNYKSDLISVQGIENSSSGSSGTETGGTETGGTETGGTETGGTETPVQEGTQVCTFAYSGSFFTVTGSTSNSKGSVTYNGTKYETCLKVESKTNVSFTTTKASKLTIVLDANSTAAIMVDGTEYKASAGIVTVNLGAGSHSITKKDTCNIFYISVE